jgi:hypothetical protein
MVAFWKRTLRDDPLRPSDEASRPNTLPTHDDRLFLAPPAFAPGIVCRGRVRLRSLSATRTRRIAFTPNLVRTDAGQSETGPKLQWFIRARNKCFRVATAVFPTPVSFRVEQSRSECSVTRQSSLASVAEWESEWTEWQWVSIHVMVIKWHANRAGNEILSSLKRRNNLETITNRMP